jgi:cell division protein FtsB
MAQASMLKFRVQGPRDESLSFYFRVKRAWPRENTNGWQVIEVTRQEEDDPSDQWRLGQQSFNLIKADPYLKVMPLGDPVSLAEADSKLRALTARVAELEGENAGLREVSDDAEKLQAEVRVLKKENAKLSDRVRLLEAERAKRLPRSNR